MVIWWVGGSFVAILRYKVRFLGSDTPIEFQSLSDHWLFPMEARIRTLAVHNKLVHRLPWEKLLFGDAPLPDQPDAVRIDGNLLVDCSNSRSCMMRAFAKAPNTDTFAEVIQLMQTSCAHLKEERNDRFVALALNFLKHVAEKLADKMCRDIILEAFPAADFEDVQAAFKKTLAKIASVRMPSIQAAQARAWASDSFSGWAGRLRFFVLGDGWVKQ